MRKLSDTFLKQLTMGFLSEISGLAKEDHDLNLEIRNNYINLYFKGHSLLKLSEKNPECYSIQIHEKFKLGLEPPKYLTNIDSTSQFLELIPLLKKNIQKISKSSLEMEYEQMIIRANNFEKRNNSEYFIIDRQYVVGKDRFDLTGFYWKNKGRRKFQIVDMCLMEVKFALNSDIAIVHQQIERYYNSLKPKAAFIAEEGETLFKQKLELGLFEQSPDRIEAMKTLTFARDISRFQFILFLIDFNPYSSIFSLEKLKVLPFSNQIRVFSGGFAMWHKNTSTI